MAEEIAQSGKPVKSLVITEEGGTLKSIESGSRMVKDMLQTMNQVPRAILTPADLVVAMDCAGSDATSGLASNPAVGVAADMLVEAGGTVYSFNVWKELLGLGEVLAERAANEEVAQQLKRECRDEGNPTVNLGNQVGGITTYREKAVGALAKSGTHPIKGVVNTFDRPVEPGLYMQVFVEGSNEGESDPQCAMAMAASGAHIVVETTGVGTVTGGVVAPVIKVCANSKTIAMLGDDIDIDASPIMSGDKTVEQVGSQIYNEIIEVATGKQTCTELLGHFED
jgi:altronate dehydratase large subunit